MIYYSCPLASLNCFLKNEYGIAIANPCVKDNAEF